MSQKMFRYSVQIFTFHFWPKSNWNESHMTLQWAWSWKGPNGWYWVNSKNLAFKKVKFGHCIIDATLQITQYTNEICESIISLDISVNHLLEKPEDVKNVKPIPDTIQVYKVIRCMNISCFAIEFYLFKLRYWPQPHPLER